MNTYTPVGTNQPIQLDKNNNFIDPVTGELMHVLTVEEMPCHTFGAEFYKKPEWPEYASGWNDTKYIKFGLKEKSRYYLFCVEPMENNKEIPFVTSGECYINKGELYILTDMDLGLFKQDESKHFVNSYNSWKIRYYMPQPGLPKQVWNEYWPRIKEANGW